MRKAALGLLLLSFLAVVIAAIALKITHRHVYEEIHEIAGTIFIALAFLHIYLHKGALKAMFISRFKK